MRRSPLHQQNVRQVFDQLAVTYAQRYSQQQPYLQYWFNERLRIALGNKDYHGKHILDIGAGNGALYQALHEKNSSFSYQATDVSAAMLAESNIPIAQRWVGEISDWPAPTQEFDHIFMLGLVSYLSAEDLSEHLRWAREHLHPEGGLCISFTNRASWDFRLRRVLRPLLRLWPGRGVLQQTFTIQAHSIKEVEALCTEAGFYMVQLKYVALGIPFLQHLSPALAAKAGIWLNDRLLADFWRRRLCPDFLVHLRVTPPQIAQIPADFL